MQNNELEKIDKELNSLEVEKEREDVINALKEYKGQDEVITSKQAQQELEIELKNPPKKFNTGIDKLDRIIDGFREGDLVVLSAPTKHGKTSLLQTFTHGFAKKDIPVLWFSYELRKVEFLRKFGDKIPYFVLPSSLTDNSVKWIEKRIIEAKAKYGAKVIMVDHLHFLLDMDSLRRANVSLLIGGITRELKRIAIKWNVIIFLVAHTTKGDYEDKPPGAGNIRDSSFITQDSDTTLMLYRLKDKKTKLFTNEARLSVVLNRRTGEAGSIDLVFKNNLFYEKSYREQDDIESIKRANSPSVQGN